LGPIHRSGGAMEAPNAPANLRAQGKRPRTSAGAGVKHTLRPPTQHIKAAHAYRAACPSNQTHKDSQP
ncbi:hypothetical protein, partial [Celeribacter halophilus]|uniref:hypothetical protein n=1 Tax=Celeribacter halophilus TaxID=576117 RepID=UPI002FD09B7D